MPATSSELTPAQVLALYPAHSQTIASLLASRVARVPDHDAVQFEARIWSYAQLRAASLQLARAFALQGCVKGDRIALVSANTDLSALLFFATAHLGALFVPLNPQSTTEELDYLLRHSRARIVVCQHEDLARVRAIAERIRPGPHLLDLDELGVAARNAAEVGERLAALAAGAADASLPQAGPDDPAVVIYTSGTTGSPKGVVHTQRSYVLAAEAFVERQHLQPTDRLLTVLPFYHINALFYSLGGAIAAGAALIVTRSFSASRFWHLAAQTRATQCNFLAAVGNILAKRPRAEFDPKHCIRKMYGGPMSEEMQRVFEQEFGVPTLIDGYGMTEIPGTSCNPFLGPHKSGSIGRPAVHPRFAADFVAMRIEDEGGKVLPNGAVGELVVKTPILFREYLDDPQQTAASFRDGWFLTGDLARRDEDGYFFFVARKKDIIRRRGENISGAELDRVISSHPDVLEAAAIGVPAELGDEEILVVIVARAAAHPAAQDILEWCRGKLASWKVPRYVVFADALPHTPSHRVAKHRLKADTGLQARAYDAQAAPSRGERIAAHDLKY